MSAPIRGQFALKYICNVLVKNATNNQFSQTYSRGYSILSRISKKFEDLKIEERPELDASDVKSPTKALPVDVSREAGRRKRQCIEEVKSYNPPADVEEYLEKVVADIYRLQKADSTEGALTTGSDTWKHIKLTDRMKKYKLLVKAMDRFDHDIPNFDLHFIETVDDVLKYFLTEVSDKSVYDQMADMDLPRNLHMNVEAMRWDPENDQLYGGKTAFPGSPTIVSSIKYRRKYKGNSG